MRAKRIMTMLITLSIVGIGTACSVSPKLDNYIYKIKTSKGIFLTYSLKENSEFIGLATSRFNDDIDSSWIISATDDGYYRIETGYQRYCLALSDNSSLTISSYAGLDFQKWQIIKEKDGYRICPKLKKNLCIDSEELNLAKKKNKNSQVFYLEKFEEIQAFDPQYLEEIKRGASSQIRAYADSLAAIDGANRVLSSYDDVGPARDVRYVGMFYWLWHGDFAGSRVYDMTKEINEAKDMRDFRINLMEEYWWGQPELGYYNSNDYYVHVKNLIMMGNAGVDFIYLDYTNGFWHNSYKTLFKAYDYCRDMGIQVPRFTFFFNVDNDKMIENAYRTIYSKGLQEDMWFYWEGKPLLMTQKPSKHAGDEITNFFTFRKTWAFEVDDKERWNFLDEFPSKYGYTDNQYLAEYMPVIKCHGAPLVQYGTLPRKGSSFNWLEPKKSASLDERFTTKDTGLGIAFQQFFDRALMIDPLVIGITGWNEWSTRAWEANKGLSDNYTFMGKKLEEGDPYLVDQFNIEFNRDIEPMKGGYSDNYYYQLVENIRRYKGMDKLEKNVSQKTITIDGNFDDWEGVDYKFYDIKGDTLHRDGDAYIKSRENKYINTTGRNDFLYSKIAYDKDNIYFLIETLDPITSYLDPEWMLIFINSNMKYGKGFEGFDYLINNKVINDKQTLLQKWEKGKWVDTNVILDYRVSGNRLELKLPIDAINKDIVSKGFYFKLADNVQGIYDIENFFVNGDTAPDRRFSFIAKFD